MCFARSSRSRCRGGSGTQPNARTTARDIEGISTRFDEERERDSARAKSHAVLVDRVEQSTPNANQGRTCDQDVPVSPRSAHDTSKQAGSKRDREHDWQARPKRVSSQVEPLGIER